MNPPGSCFQCCVHFFGVKTSVEAPRAKNTLRWCATTLGNKTDNVVPPGHLYSLSSIFKNQYVMIWF